MKQFHLSNIQIPDWRYIDWKSPINTITALSILGGLLYIIYPDIVIYGAIWSAPVGFFGSIQEFIMYSFLHAGFFHTLSNVIFFLFIGRIIELTHGQRWTWMLWWWTTLFVGIFLFLFSESPTIWGSGFAMALLAVYAHDFYRRKQYEDLKWAILLLIINIVLGLGATVSLMGHFSGALAGYLYSWYMHKHTHKHFWFMR